MADLEEAVDKVWNLKFLELMRNRLRMGHLRYGARKPGGKRYDYIEAMRSKLNIYQTTGNTEMFVDIANYAMLAFEHDDHPKKHFEANDDVGHAKEK
jgi:hypothetical protein